MRLYRRPTLRGVCSNPHMRSPMHGTDPFWNQWDANDEDKHNGEFAAQAFSKMGNRSRNRVRAFVDCLFIAFGGCLFWCVLDEAQCNHVDSFKLRHLRRAKG